MEYLYNVWPDFTAAAANSKHILLLADYDGTLTHFVGNPEQALLSESVRRKLQTLAAIPEFKVGIVSGRSLSELKSLVAVDGIYYSGNHGIEIEGPGLNYVQPEAGAARTVIAELAEQFDTAFKDVPGVIIQPKGFSLSVHFRLSEPENEELIASVVKKITAPYIASGEIIVYPMKKIWEVRPPVIWDKGKAVEFIRERVKVYLELSNLPTIYLGDDTTDEDAFKVLKSPEGWGIFVCGEKTISSAEYYLNSIEEVEDFLGRLIQLKTDT